MIPSQIGPYILEKNLGKGTYGVVYRAIHEKFHTDVAIKIIPKNQLDRDEARLRFSREVSLLQRIDHPFVPQFFQVIEDAINHYLVMEFVPNGDLISLQKPTDEYTAKRIFIQLIAVLEYLHEELRIAHRDLKAENIMLDKYNNIRLIDYGLSNCFTLENPNLKTACGSAYYIPPEVIKKQKYTSAVDIWSAGVLLYNLATGKFPFYDENVSNVLQKIVYSDPYFPPTISSQFSDLIKKMLVKQPENRITLEMIKRHPWFSLPEYQRMCDFIKENLNASNFTSPFSNTNISQSFSRSSISDQVIDPEIVTRMTEMGIDVGNLKVCLFMRNHTEATAVYKMLRRHKLIEKMKDGVKINLKEKMRPDKLTIVTAHPDNGSTDDIPQSAPTDGKRSLLSPRIISRSTRIQNIQKRFSHDIKNSDKKRNT